MFTEDFKPLQQTVSLSSFDKRHSLITSDDDFSDDSLENAAERDSSTEIIEIKLECRETDDLQLPSPEHSQPIPPLSLPLNKCSPGIAWEIKLDDNTESDIHTKV